MKIIAFDTEAEALAFQRLEWIAKVKLLVAAGETAENNAQQFFTDVSGLSDETIGDLKICGYVDESLKTDNGYTVAYAEIYKAENVSKWYTREPEQGLIDLTGYEIIDLPSAWIPEPKD